MIEQQKDQPEPKPEPKFSFAKTLAVLAALAVPTAAIGLNLSNPDKPAPTTAAELDERVKIVLDELNSRLLERELKEDEFSDLLYDLTTREGLLDVGIVYDFDDAGELGRLIAIFSQKLDAHRLNGISCDYTVLENTPISEDARRDHAAYVELCAKVEAALDREIGGKRVSESMFDAVVREVLSDTEGVPFFGFRRAELTGKMSGTFQHEYNVVSDEEYESRPVDADRIREALDRIRTGQ